MTQGLFNLKTQPVKEVCLGIFDGPHATPSDSAEGPIFLGIRNITESGSLDFSEIKHISDAEYPKWTKRVVPKEGDVVFTYEATLHHYARIPSGFHGCLGRRVALIRPDPKKLNSKYLLYHFLSKSWRATMESYVIIGATVNRIPIEKFPEFPITLPPLAIQTRIADILSPYDDLIENNRRQIERLEESAQLLYREWFMFQHFPGHEQVKVIDGLPEGWEICKAYDCIEVMSGGTPKTSISDYWNGDIPFFTPKDAGDSFYSAVTEKTLTGEGLRNCNSQLFPINTVFITARGTVGKIRLAQVPMAMNQSCYALKGKDGIPPLFLYLTITSSVEEIKARANGAVFDAIVVDTFKTIPFLKPSSEIMKKFEDSVVALFESISNLTKQNRKLAEARDLLLPCLMSGEIEV